MTRWHYTLYLTWGPRLEDSAACAARLASMLRAWAAAHFAFGRWQRCADTREEANALLCAMPPEIEELTRLCEAGRRDHEDGALKDEREGTRIQCWNGRLREYGAGLEFIVGASLVNFPNFVWLGFGPACDCNRDLVSWAGLRPVVEGAIAAWEPDWGWVFDLEHPLRLERAQGGYLPKIRAGWITYLSAPLASRVRFPEAVAAERRHDGSLLIRTCDEAFDVEDPAHLAAADLIQASLAPLQQLERHRRPRLREV